MSEMPEAGSFWIDGRDNRVMRAVLKVGGRIIWARVSHGLQSELHQACSLDEWAAWVERTGARDVSDA